METQAERLATLEAKMDNVVQDIVAIRGEMDKYVLKVEYSILQKIVYSAATAVVVIIVGAILKTILKQ